MGLCVRYRCDRLPHVVSALICVIRVIRLIIFLVSSSVHDLSDACFKDLRWKAQGNGARRHRPRSRQGRGRLDNGTIRLGKSTLLNLIAGLDRPTAGDIRIEGQSLSTLSDDELTRVRRDKIGFIFQFFNLLPTLNCVENVALPLHLRGWPRRKIQERSRELLEMVQLGHRLDHLPEELSGGERQRVAIARALSVYPPVLLADEPTGNLDTRTGQEILKLIQGLHAKLGSTIMIVTHDLDVAEQCSRTVSLRDGHIVEDHRR